jgi:hypothetical protein
MAGENTARTAETEGQNAERTSDSGQQEAVKEAVRRERSSIGFPYNPLDDAVEVARAIHDHVGVGECDDAQLSVWLGQSSKSSGYRMQLTAARMFGVLDPTSDTRKLTALGRMIVDPRQERAARADAFLRVPLYSALYEKHKDGVLPPADALEIEIVGLGVAEKQKMRARQVFERSAQQAGYSEHGKNRLVRPGVAPLDQTLSEEASKSGGGNGGDGKTPDIDPIIRGLLARLPKSGDVWPEAERKLWLDLLAGSFKLIYKDAPPPPAAYEQGGTPNP